MKWLILNTDYPEFLADLYGVHPGLQHCSYNEQFRARSDSLFGVADFYSVNLRKIGHQAQELHVNNEPMQRAWAREHKMSVPKMSWLGRQASQLWTSARRSGGIAVRRYLRSMAPLPGRRPQKQPDWVYAILEGQIKTYRPDVILNQAMDAISGGFLKRMKPYARLIVGQNASPVQTDGDFSAYDLIVSSLEPFVERYGNLGIPARLSRFAFEPDILNRIPECELRYPVSFIGNLSQFHEERIVLLEQLCALFDVSIWGPGIDRIASGSIIRKHYRGRAWGSDMYRVLRASRITINHHAAAAGDYANNMRLFEATGSGALLMTDRKCNLSDLFVPGQEVAAYGDPKECAEKVKYYLAHSKEAVSVARAGQNRTLRDHTFQIRVRELVENVEHLLHGRADPLMAVESPAIC